MNHSVTESGTADNQEPLFSETFRKKSDRAPSSEKAQKSLWADFAATGNVEAYLRYRRAFGQRISRRASEPMRLSILPPYPIMMPLCVSRSQ